MKRVMIWKCLHGLEMPKKLTRIFTNIYKDVEEIVQIAGERSSDFEIEKETKQGDGFSPPLIIMDKFITNITKQTEQLKTANDRNLLPR